MIAFPCPGCGKGLKVKDELAGKKGKCPHCQQGVTIPTSLTKKGAPSRREVPAESQTVPPLVAPLPHRPTRGPGRPTPAEDVSVTHGGGEPPAHTVGPGAAANPEHFDFLAPPGGPDELGRLGPYRVLRVLGAGGMGVVFAAEDLVLKRKVALKTMLPALAASDTAKQRFLREAQTAAAIEHDHIVPIFQVGEDRGVPFIAMPLLKGEPLDQRLQRQPVLPVAEVLRIGRETAKGLAAAHDAGLIHRDVKPANLWLEGDEGRVKVLDFGLARGTAEGGQLTLQGAIVGSPAYMAPEQATGPQVDSRCDLFSLGCVLYRLATGEPPFKGNDILATLMAVATEEPRPPAELNPTLPPALSQLILELLAKSPEDRPASAWVVIDALSAIEQDRTSPYAAPPGRKEAGAKASVAVGRHGSLHHRIVLWGPLAAAAVLVIVLGVILVLRTRHGGERAMDARRQLAVDVLPVKPDGAPALDALRPELIPVAERFDWQPRELVAVLGEHRQRSWGNVWEVAYTPDGRTVVSRGSDGGLHLWDAATLRERAHLRGHVDGVTSMAISPDGRRLLTGAGRDGSLRLWDLETGRLLTLFGGRHTGEVTRVAFSPDGRRALSAGRDSSVKLWNAESGKGIRALHGHGGPVGDVVFLPDGKRALSAGDGKGLLLWDLETGKATSPLAGQAGGVWSIALLPDGHRVVSGGRDKMLRLWDVKTGKEIHSFKDFPGDVRKVTVSPDGRLALCRCNGELSLFDVEARVLVGRFGQFTASAAFAPDSRRILYGGRNQALHLWDVGSRKEVGSFNGHQQFVHGLAISPDGRHAVSGGDDNTVRLWDVATGKEVHAVEGPTGWCTSVAFSPDGRRLVSGNWDRVARVWDLTGKGVRLLEGNTGGVRRVAFSPDGRWVLSAAQDGTLQRWDAETGLVVRVYKGHNGAVHGMAISPDGTRLISCGVDHTVRLWDLESGRGLRALQGHTNWVHGVAVSADGRRALSGSADKTVRLWDLDTGTELHRREDAKDEVHSVALAPDGRTGVAGCKNHQMLLWTGLDTAQPHAVEFPELHAGPVRQLAFAHDGRTLASSGNDGRVILWDAANVHKLQEWVLPGPVAGVAFAPDGRHLAICNSNGTAYILRLPSSVSQTAQ
jgi:WD40 repeat protein/tRNA A-37 threonylcarbamoyl transferase component Bud32